MVTAALEAVSVNAATTAKHPDQWGGMHETTQLYVLDCTGAPQSDSACRITSTGFPNTGSRPWINPAHETAPCPLRSPWVGRLVTTAFDYSAKTWKGYLFWHLPHTSRSFSATKVLELASHYTHTWQFYLTQEGYSVRMQYWILNLCTLAQNCSYM